MEDSKAELRWGVEQRLEFIEFRLFWEGRVNRSDLMDQFGVSVNQASADLNRYIGLAPDNMVYDKSARTYVRTPDFKAHFSEPDASKYLAQLRSVADGILDRDDAWITELPPFASAPTPVRGVNPATLRSVVGAIRRSEAIEVKYQSLSRPEPSWRWIAPHAIAFDGFRWHARAYCLTDECFKDFLLSRILDIRGSRESDTSADEDCDWHCEVTLEVGPHPELSETQAKVIALDYGMRGGKAKIKVRRALLYYALKRLGLDTDPSARTPQNQQIILINRGDVMAAIPSSQKSGSRLSTARRIGAKK
ncbi:WYL domain-containing protein [Pseudoruegeria sp. SHC-113]|uniref:WYL domain-containing protein n=1 Tax=Pseudoruegeria sp. SHC-113 TaxID=2855439 RepID=UPI0021BA9BED|nr:WYL domain-containing protein [Pseudoruegeria sp. SHC-113]MCT8159412.1 WYL domain-containing protein [Pseudoruegeria sp. SHC-113]